MARQGELSDLLLSCGLGLSDYDGAACELPAPALDPHNGRTRLAPHVRDASREMRRDLLVPHAPGGPDCLRPYRPLNAEAIVLSGEANSFGREDRAEVFRLMKVWDAKAPLLLWPGVLPDIRCSRVFGSFKSPGKFRQRPARVNSLESRLDGVSHLLPQGFMLTKVHAPRFTHQLRGSTTHRKDFYSQCMFTRERAFSNAVKPSFVLRDFAGTRAYDEYVAWAQHDAGLLQPQVLPRP